MNDVISLFVHGLRRILAFELYCNETVRWVGAVPKQMNV